MEKKLKFIWVLTIVNSTIIFLFLAVSIATMFLPTPNTDLSGYVDKTLKEYGEWTGKENQKTKEMVQNNLDSNLKQIQEIVDGNQKWVEESLEDYRQWTADYVKNN